jgi:hypothetical protein
MVRMNASPRIPRLAAMIAVAVTFALAIVHLTVLKLPFVVLVGSMAVTAMLCGVYAQTSRPPAP